MSLYEMLAARRGDLLIRWSELVRHEVGAAGMTEGELVDSMPLFVEELIAFLDPAGRDDSSAPASSSAPGRFSARVHGAERLRLGFDVTAVVREYNLLRRAFFDLTRDDSTEISVEEIQVFSEFIAHAQAQAVGEYQKKRDQEQTRQAAEHLAFLAHEMRNPLSSTITAFTLARNRVAPEAGKYVSIIDRGLKRVMDVLDNALIAGRVLTGVSPNLEAVDIVECVREVVGESLLIAEDRGMSLRMEIPDNLTINADLRLLRSVLSNLVNNAIKFSRAGSEIMVRAHRADTIAVVEVEDGCGGLPADKVSAIFDPHVQVGTDRSGFGLGLAIAKQAAEAHRGTLQVQNLEGRGCCFRLELPADDETPP